MTYIASLPKLQKYTLSFWRLFRPIDGWVLPETLRIAFRDPTCQTFPPTKRKHDDW
jgi:hypothetical protein